MRLKRLATVSAIVAVGLAAISATSVLSEKAANEASSNADQCFNARFVRNFMMPDSRRMIVVAGGNKVFELTLFSACMNIEDATQIGIRTRNISTVCEGWDATILYRDMGRPQECVVSNVRRLSADEAAQYVSNPR